MSVQEYLAIGEAPDQVRNCYQQRSRWCKGHFQIIFNKEHCPLLQSKLSVRATRRPPYQAAVVSPHICIYTRPSADIQCVAGEGRSLKTREQRGSNS